MGLYIHKLLARVRARFLGVHEKASLRSQVPEIPPFFAHFILFTPFTAFTAFMGYDFSHFLSLSFRLVRNPSLFSECSIPFQKNIFFQPLASRI